MWKVSVLLGLSSPNAYTSAVAYWSRISVTSMTSKLVTD